MNNSNSCELHPLGVEDQGVLYLAPPTNHTRTVVGRALARAEVAFYLPETGVIAVPLDQSPADWVAELLLESLSDAERHATRSLVLPDGAGPTLKDVLRTRPLATWVAAVQGRWVLDLVREDRLTTHFQPIVRADDPFEIFAYECLLRGRAEDGVLISPGRMYDAARGTAMLFHLDRAARLTALREATAHRIRERLFINFNPGAIDDPADCLRSTVEAVEAAGVDPGRVVFEVVESETILGDLAGIVASYREAGFRIALNDLGAGYNSLSVLGRLHPDYVKLDLKLVRDVDRDRYQAEITAKVIEMARKVGIQTIAEGVESAGELVWLQNHGVNFIQGYHIARPASPPPRFVPLDDRPVGNQAAALAIPIPG